LGPQRSKFHALNVYGTRKTFINDMPYGKLFDGDGAENERLVTTPYPGVEKGDLIPDFIAAIRNGEEPPVSATDVFRVMDICFAAWEASQTGTAVKINYLV
jgi:predicted dehydrogenase